ncbi:MAG: HAD family phosphatase [Flavobacteriales bacterium]|nr:HAD family phosphatase [Flavobacteriales bacterium]
MGEFDGIKNIVFDLGVVLFDLDYKLTIEAFKELGVDKHEEFFSEADQIMIFDKFERGEIPVQEFLESLRNLLPGKANDASIIRAWNAMLLSFPQSSIDLLNALRPHYKLYLLSNTNDLHFECFHTILKAQHGLKGLKEFFSAVYYSNKEGFRKPEAEFYNKLIEQEALNPEETVFIDDMLKNVLGAREVGIHGILLENGRSITALFDQAYKFRG